MTRLRRQCLCKLMLSFSRKKWPKPKKLPWKFVCFFLMPRVFLVPCCFSIFHLSCSLLLFPLRLSCWLLLRRYHFGLFAFLNFHPFWVLYQPVFKHASFRMYSLVFVLFLRALIMSTSGPAQGEGLGVWGQGPPTF